MSKKPTSVRFVLRTNAGKSRREAYNSVEHLVVPMVGLVEGVLWSVNAPAPALVLAEEFAIAPAGWNGRPIFINHPQEFGTYGSGNTPALLEKEAVGLLFNANDSLDALATKKLRFEGWLNIDRLTAHPDGPDLIARIEKDEAIEVSTGLLTLMENTAGTFHGKKYDGIWRNIIPDHLALIPNGKGACSVDMGCGIFANAVHVLNTAGEPELISEEATVKTLTERVLSLMPFIRRGTEVAVQEAGDSDSDVRRLLEDALRATIPGYIDLEAVYPEGDTESSIEGACCVYSVYPPGGSYTYQAYRRGYILSEGKVTFGEIVEKVRSRRVYEVVNASGDPAAPVVQQEPPSECGCGHQRQGEEAMNKTQRINALCAKVKTLKAEDLANVSESVLVALEAQAETNPGGGTGGGSEQPPAQTPPPQVPSTPPTPPPAPPPPAPPPPAQPSSQAASELTGLVTEFRAMLGDADLRAGIAMLKAQGAGRKSQTIALLKTSGRNKFTDEQLDGKSQDELDMLVELAGVSPRAQSTAFMDFGGLGAPRLNVSGEEPIPAPPSLVEAINAARKTNDTVQ